MIERPERIADLPDVLAGCGMGQPYGDAALEVYLDKTGRGPAHSGLPVLEDIG